MLQKGVTPAIRIEIDKFPFVVGRDPGNHLIIEDADISRVHFQIKKRGRIYIIEDLGSRNGTFVNGDRVINNTIHNGDTVQVGSQTLSFFAAQDDIYVTSDFTNLDWIANLDFETGVSSPIKVLESEQSMGRQPHRYDPQKLLETSQSDQNSTKVLFEVYNDVSVFADIVESSRVLLKSLIRLHEGIQKSCFFVWNATNRTIVPIAHWNHGAQLERFGFDEQSLKDAITRKTPIKLAKINSLPETIILPMSHHDIALAVLHIEISATSNASEMDISNLYRLIQVVAPVFETLMLRREMDTWMVGMVETMIATVEAKDTYTRGHSERVCRYAMAIADQLLINKETKRMLMISSLCHDIGKIGIPDAILKKASILSAEEYQEIKLHPDLGAEIVKHMPGFRRFISGVKYHHEKWDGTGYPDGLEGENIPFFGRIIGLVDVFDAMVSGRAYSGFMNQTEAVQKLVAEGDLFDPELLKVFVKCYESGSLKLKNSTASDEISNTDDKGVS